MSEYRLTRNALDDLESITNYLAELGGWDLSMRVEEQLFDTFESLALTPGLGHSRTDLTILPLLFFTRDPYVIIFERDVSPARIHAVLHGARDLKRTLRNRLF